MSLSSKPRRDSPLAGSQLPRRRTNCCGVGRLPMHESSRHLISNSDGDADLVRRVQNGDSEAIDELGLRLACIARFLQCRNSRTGGVLPKEDLHDLAQDVAVLVWRKLGTYRAEASLETWIYRFCELQLRNRIRRVIRERQHRAKDAHDVAVQTAAVAAALDKLDRSAKLLELLDSLRGEDATIVRQRFFEGASFAEIAANVGSSEGTVKSRCYRALDRLRESLRFLGENGPRLEDAE